MHHRLVVISLKYVATAALLCSSLACASTASSTGATPKHGATRPASTSAGFEAYLASEQRWVEPEAFLAADRATKRPNRWPDAATFPPYDQTKEHDEIVLLTPDGPCDMYFFHTRWRRRADVRAWGNQLRAYQACGTVFTRDIAFAPATPSS